jgi:hypothetical protein
MHAKHFSKGPMTIICLPFDDEIAAHLEGRQFVGIIILVCQYAIGSLIFVKIQAGYHPLADRYQIEMQQQVNHIFQKNPLYIFSERLGQYKVILIFFGTMNCEI